MNTKLLKQKILDLAIHGKLVPQNPDDEPASQLLRRISEEKEKLIAQGKIKRPKKSDAVNPAQECPFEIPNSWEWVKLGEIAETCLGKMLDKDKNSGTPRKYLRNLNVRWFSFDMSDILEMKIKDSELERCSVKKGDLLICEGGYPGRSAIWNEDYSICFQKAVHRVRFYKMPTMNKYFNFFLYLMAENQSLDRYITGSGIQHLTGKELIKIPIPLPPLAEQHRIVSAIEKWFSLIDEIETNKESLQAAIKQTKSKVLDLAIKGKLVKKTAEWKTVTLGEIAEVINGKSQKKVEDANGEYPIYGSGGIIGRANSYLCPENCTIIGRKGTINNPIFVNTKFWNVDTAFGMQPSQKVDCKFFYYFCKSFNFAALDTSTAVPSLTKTKIQQILFPLPPLAEQTRIVSKIEEVFALLDEIERELA